MKTPDPPARSIRTRLCLSGQVQGVGFRPHVYRLAQALALSGWVRNGSRGVEILVQGSREAIHSFRNQLFSGLPPLARITGIEEKSEIPVSSPGAGFRILESRTGEGGGGWIPPDVSLCPDCLSELFDPKNRRYRYPFIVCTSCGPRLTLTRAVPYDRKNTSMEAFPLCPDCRAEYDDPGDRRFHAEPIACPRCGPSLSSPGQNGAPPVRGEEALREAIAAIKAGKIWAIKGVGGFHLVADATRPEAVARLRARKRRPSKPFALMALNIASVRTIAEVSLEEEALLIAPERPIVLLPGSPEGLRRLSALAPGINTLGVMLPYTALHWLLFQGLAGGSGRMDPEAPCPVFLVMTSANPAGEPLVIDNDRALETLSPLADGFLLHDREIVIRADDSVVRQGVSGPVVIRRSRGYAPAPLPLSLPGPPVLALGGAQKNTLCFLSDKQAFLSPHIGDLSTRESCLSLSGMVDHFLGLIHQNPVAVASDAHPDFYSTILAEQIATERGIPHLRIFHHHAHAASVMAQKGITGPVLAVVFDGFGLGPGGEPRGGELLRLDGAEASRIGHLFPLRLPGGDRAAREPWRVAAALLDEMGMKDRIPVLFPGQPLDKLSGLFASDRISPRTTSAGRLFDAAAAFLGIASVSTYEGEAAMRLESLASRANPFKSRPGEETLYRLDPGHVLNCLPLMEALLSENHPEEGAALFHRVLAAGVLAWVEEASRETGLSDVVLSGGCFLNQWLTTILLKELPKRGLRPHVAGGVSPGDGGLALGQAWIARQILTRGDRSCVLPYRSK